MSENRGIGLDDLPTIQHDQFAHYLAVARRDNDPHDWPTFRHALLEAITAAFGLDEDDEDAQASRMATLGVLDSLRSRHDPAESWRGFMESLWRQRHAIRPDLA